MKKEKSNITHLRAILEELDNHEFGEDQFKEKIQEANEFIDAIEEEYKDAVLELEDSISDLREKGLSKDSEISELKENPATEEYFVGLDTIHIGYQHGNLRIQQQVESFIEGLQRENAVVPA